MAIDDDNRGTLDGFTEPVTFDGDAVDQADDRQGVHVVWADGELIFVGQSAKTRTRLRQHFTAGRSGSVLHKQVGDLLDDELGREASKEEIGDWLRKCTVAWKYDNHPGPLKAQLMADYEPRFNTVAPKGGPTPRSKTSTPSSNPGYEADESELIRLTLDSLVEEYRESAVQEEFASSEAWLENADAISAAVEELRDDQDLNSFSRALANLPNPPAWFKQGAHRTFVGTLADRAEDPDAPQIVADAFSIPEDQEDADAKIVRLFSLAEGVDRLYPGPGFAPLAASVMWCFMDPLEWPWLSADAEPALHILRLMPRYAEVTDRYRLFRHLVLTASASPPEVLSALSRASHVGSRSLSGGIYRRLTINSELLQNWYESESYENEDTAGFAERNIESVLGELDLFAKGMNEEIADQLVRELVTSKTGPRVGNELRHPFRADGYAIFTIEKNMTLPAIRVWATPSGLGIGAHFGQRKYDESEEMAREVAADLPSGMEFFEVRAHREGDRLNPAGREPIRGELFVGRWSPGGLTGPDVGDKTIESVAALQPVFDQMVRSVGEVPGPGEADDELASLYEEFIEATGYPTETNRTNKAEREEMEAVISEDGLLAFDLHEFRRIFNTARYGSPGPQSILNASLSQMSPEELDLFANNLEFLLRGNAPLEDRINALMDQSDRGVKGLGEAVITKLLAIEKPSEIVPIFVYRGPKGKARMLNILGLREEGLDGLDIGRRAVRSNEILRNRLAPLFGDDMLGISRFLYWLSERDEVDEVAATDEIDRIGNLADELLLPREDLDEIVELLEAKRQVVFYGPPGTGKTYLARELAKALAPDPAQRMLVQFHPSTSYEDFFEGYRPETDAQGRLTYRLVKGPLALIAERARENPLKRYVLVIDEINRANLPKVFGELLFLLEYRDETVRSLYRPDEPFELSRNLWIIGTMNTADRSIALIDAAMRRRFHFVGFFPDEGFMADLLREWIAANAEGDSGWVADLLDMVNEELRERLGGPHLQIGPSHFMQEDLSEPALERIWKYSIYPYIEEQLYGDEAAIKEYEFWRVMKRFEDEAPDIDDNEDDEDPTPGME